MRFPNRTHPSCVVSLSRYGKYCRISGTVFSCVSAHPSSIIFLSKMRLSSVLLAWIMRLVRDAGCASYAATLSALSNSLARSMSGPCARDSASAMNIIVLFFCVLTIGHSFVVVCTFVA